MFQERKLIAALLCFTGSIAIASPPDSLVKENWNKPRFFFQFDRYNSFVSNIGANISGFKTGLEFARKYRFGLGFYNLKSDIIDSLPLSEQDAANATNDTVRARLNMVTIPFCFEYMFYEKDPWQFSLPINLGIGQTYFTYFDKYGKEKRLRDAPIINYEVAIVGQYKILRWFGVGAGVGYRLMLLDNPAKKHSFNSPIYTIKLKIFVGEIIRTVFPKKKKKE